LSGKFLISFFKISRDVEKLHPFFNRIRRKEIAVGEELLNTISVSEQNDYIKLRVSRDQDESDYFEVRYDLKSRKIEEKNNIWIMPFLKVELKDSTHYSNHPFLLMRVLQSEKSLCVDFQSLDHFIDYGYLPTDKTFIKGLNKINGLPVNLTANEEKFDQNRFWKVFVRAVEKIFQSNKSITFNMSGGLDTRFITFALLECGYRPDQVVTVQSPFLIEGRDADVEIAKLICSKLNWKHKIETPPPEQYNYFKTAESGEIILSGLYGGEIYGGQVAHFFDDKNLSFPEAILIALNTNRSIIYSSTARSWSSPSSLHFYSISPFTDKDLVKYLMEFPIDQFMNYLQYNSHYNRIKNNFFDIPLCTASSDLTFRSDQIAKYVNPKNATNPVNRLNQVSLEASTFMDYSRKKLIGKNKAEVKIKNLENYYIDMLRFSIQI